MRNVGTNIDNVIKAIIPFNNRYRDPSSSTREKLVSMWEIGNQLHKLGVRKPHSVGRAIQKVTEGLIKRPTIFRSFKTRTIWPSKDELLQDIGRITGLSNLKEIFPLIDPEQKIRSTLEKQQLNEIYIRACSDPPEQFKRYVVQLKKKLAYGRLGKPLDKSRHLRDLEKVAKDFACLHETLDSILRKQDPSERNEFRSGTTVEELIAFSNMCIALTTKTNLRLYRRLGKPTSESTNDKFQVLYNYFFKILGQKTDEERARLRRLISSDSLAQMSDAISSVSTEEAVGDYRARQKITISL